LLLWRLCAWRIHRAERHDHIILLCRLVDRG
jgi:hypothetical protein